MHRQQYYVKTEQPANGAFLSLMARCAALRFTSVEKHPVHKLLQIMQFRRR